jgi:hypothetical protein
MNHSSSQRLGIGYLDALVVLVLVVLVAALIVPGIGTAREAARRTTCRNNLKQLGLALHNYHDVYSLFPPGWYPPHPDDGTGAGSWAWRVLLMPYLD